MRLQQRLPVIQPRLLVATVALWGSCQMMLGPAVAEQRPSAVTARSLFGSYLAGRVARNSHDSAAASEFYQRALERDPSNEALIEQSLLMDVIEGRFEHAQKLSQDMAARHKSHRLSQLVLGLREAKAGNFAAAHDHFKVTGGGLMGEITGLLARSWMLVAQGDVKAAGDLLESTRQADALQQYLRFHKAMVLDVAGRQQEARAVYERVFRADPRSLRIALAYARHAAHAGDRKLARTVIEDHIKRVGANAHATARALSEELRGKGAIEPLIAKPVNGLAEVFYGLGEALASEGDVATGAAYLQMSLFLDATSPFALVALANVYETTKKYADAIGVYDRIPRDGPLHQAIQIRKALNLNQLERVDEAKVILEQLAKDDPKDIKPLDALAGVLRSRKRYEEAIVYYTKAIALIGPKPDRRHWGQFYARGTSYERIKKWPQAEADLKKAMQLSPDQPDVLNYLGYSWVDQNRNLQQGLSLIERAVQLKPDNGHIVDSLGWAHYRLGNFKEAVRHLERAVELRPEDPVLNDHLGDAFWRVGRRTEARYQWEQALTLKPEPEDIAKIKQKLADGLPLPPKVKSRTKRPSQATRPDANRKRTDNRQQPTRPVIE